MAHQYVSLRTLQRRRDIAGRDLVDQRHTLDVVQRRVGNGLAAEFDLVRARAEVEATEANIPTVGRPPQALVEELSPAAAVPPSPPVVPIGLPSELLRRRPDVMAVGVRVPAMELLPDVGLVHAEVQGAVDRKPNAVVGRTEDGAEPVGVVPVDGRPVAGDGRLGLLERLVGSGRIDEPCNAVF